MYIHTRFGTTRHARRCPRSPPPITLHTTPGRLDLSPAGCWIGPGSKFENPRFSCTRPSWLHKPTAADTGRRPAATACQYQGHHPHPFLRTPDPDACLASSSRHEQTLRVAPAAPMFRFPSTYIRSRPAVGRIALSPPGAGVHKLPAVEGP